MATVPGITERAPQRPSYVDQLDAMTKGQGLTEKSIQLVKEIVGLMGTDPSVRVTNTPASVRTAEPGSPTGTTGVPALDSPDDPKAKEADLEKLISYLQLSTDKQQAELARDRIQMQKNSMESRHTEQKQKLDKSIEEMDKAARSQLMTKIFGWMLAAIAVALAVVASVATGGLAAGPLVAALMAVGMAVMNETGVMEDLTQALAGALEDAGMSKEAAQIVAAVTMAVAMIALALATGSVAGVIQNALSTGTQAASMIAATTVQATAQSVQAGMDIAMKSMMAASVAAGGYASYRSYESGLAQSEATDADKYLQIVSQQLHESQEELQFILEKIQGCYSEIVEILDSETNTQNEIAKKMGTMA